MSLPVLTWPAAKWYRVLGAARAACGNSPYGSAGRTDVVRVAREAIAGSTAVTVAATNGQWLFRWREVEAGEPGPSFDILLPRGNVKRLLRTLAVLPHEAPVSLAEDGAIRPTHPPTKSGDWTLSLGATVVRQLTPADGNFPPVEAAIPVSPSATPGPWGVSTVMLRKVSRCFRRLAGGGHVVLRTEYRTGKQPKTGDPFDAFVFTRLGHQKAIAVVMPCLLTEPS